jgi:hypothetical protein
MLGSRLDPKWLGKLIVTVPTYGFEMPEVYKSYRRSMALSVVMDPGKTCAKDLTKLQFQSLILGCIFIAGGRKIFLEGHDCG